MLKSLTYRTYQVLLLIFILLLVYTKVLPGTLFVGHRQPSTSIFRGRYHHAINLEWYVRLVTHATVEEGVHL